MLTSLVSILSRLRLFAVAKHLSDEQVLILRGPIKETGHVVKRYFLMQRRNA